MSRRWTNNFENWPEENKIKAILEVTGLETYNSVTREDLMVMLRWLAKETLRCGTAVEYSADGYENDLLINDIARCPKCGRFFEPDTETWGCNFCPECGERLIWEEEESCEGFLENGEQGKGDTK